VASIPTSQTAHVLHKLPAGDSNFLAEGGTEHHDLLVSGGGSEDFLDVTSHVYEKVSKDQ
jgi:hypothetical protein